MDAFWITAFSVGFVGSFHCVGMCAPIALALPAVGRTAVGRLGGSLLYNVGRITTYSALGVLVGLVGKGVVLAGFQQTVSILLGIALILSVLIPIFYAKMSLQNSFFAPALTRIKSRMGRLLGNPTFGNLYFIGLLNGLLPCGLVYVALTGAILTNEWWQGALYMALFGAGTLPMMLLVVQMRSFIQANLRQQLQKMIPVVVVLMGAWAIVRGLNLGIPYLSPQIYAPATATTTNLPNCH